MSIHVICTTPRHVARAQIEDASGKSVGAVAVEVSLAAIGRHLAQEEGTVGVGGVLFDSSGAVLTSSAEASEFVARMAPGADPSAEADPGSPKDDDTASPPADRCRLFRRLFRYKRSRLPT